MYYFNNGDVLKPTSICLSSNYLPEAILNMKVEPNEDSIEKDTNIISRITFQMNVINLDDIWEGKTTLSMTELNIDQFDISGR